ncbi:uncharacterized protein [Onthophagus taurus]|uniref:uncharacterized protein n=1 Tax=Onthophagus taurus TaxID=166361 RepID=UPI0039BE4171
MTVLLPVAELDIQDRFGRYHRVRALIDSCRMINFITEYLQKRLQFVRSFHSVPIEGLNNMSSTSVISQRICSTHPTVAVDGSKYSHLQDLVIHKTQTLPGPIDLLLGAELVPYILTGDRRAGAMNEPAALGSIFGWLLMGKSADLPSPTSQLSFLIEPSTDVCLQKFWELEQIKETTPVTLEDTQSENHFISTHSRTADGRFMVALPFKNTNLELGESYSQALRRFIYLEKRLIKNSEIFKKYKEFMTDYLLKNHMSLISKEDHHNKNAYYIPYHYVLNSSAKVRVVFDESAKISTGNSLNDLLLPGPKHQNDISSIIIKFRCYPIAFMCDIQQMYRQILIVPHHRDYQRILWRDYKSGELNEYQLNTVTYGVSSAPYLALRTIQELARLNAAQFPEASRVLLHDMYVDDVVTGSFSLAKWASNEPKLLKNVSADLRVKPVSLDNSEDGVVKVLGLHWEQYNDNIGFSYQPRDHICSKRAILSNIACIFDPLGLITPCILAAKCVMQRLWLEKLNWDDLPSEEIQNYWTQYQFQIPMLSQLKIPRLILPAKDLHVELHLFSDASSVGYCAVAYLRYILPNNNINISLICAKSRVAPLKTISLPRLEPCGAVLLANMTKFILSNISGIVQPEIFAWSDSMVVLNWLDSSPHRWKTFVANRTSHIQDILPGNRWRYVQSKDNPADLGQDHSQWPSKSPPTCPDESISEEKRVVIVNVAEQIEENFLHTLMNRFSVLSCRKENNHSNLSITIREKQAALYVLARRVQSESFSQLKDQIQTAPVFRFDPFGTNTETTFVVDELNVGHLPHNNFLSIIRIGAMLRKQPHSKHLKYFDSVSEM